MAQQQIIEDFWNLSGVLGIALVHESAEPYFYVKKQIQDWEKQSLIKVILQSIVKKHEKPDFFEFQAMGYHAYTYKLNYYLTLIVLTPRDIAAIKLQITDQLKAALQEDIESAITALGFLTKKISQPKAVSPRQFEGQSTPSTGSVAASQTLGVNSSAPLAVKVNIEDLLGALNHLSRFSSNYMGSKLTANYWQSTRPKFQWLENFQINHSAKITFSGAIAEPISPLQHQWIKEWAAAFIKQCSQIIQDLPNMIEQKGLDERNKSLLLTLSASELTKSRR